MHNVRTINFSLGQGRSFAPLLWHTNSSFLLDSWQLNIDGHYASSPSGRCRLGTLRVACPAKTPENERETGEACRRRRIRQHLDDCLLERSSMRKSMRQLSRQDDGLVANAPKRSDRVRDQDCGRTIDEEPEGNPRGSNAEFELGPEQPDRQQEHALKRAQRMHRQPNSRR